MRRSRRPSTSGRRSVENVGQSAARQICLVGEGGAERCEEGSGRRRRSRRRIVRRIQDRYGRTPRLGPAPLPTHCACAHDSDQYEDQRRPDRHRCNGIVGELRPLTAQRAHHACRRHTDHEHGEKARESRDPLRLEPEPPSPCSERPTRDHEQVPRDRSEEDEGLEVHAPLTRGRARSRTARSAVRRRDRSRAPTTDRRSRLSRCAPLQESRPAW